MRGEEVLSMDKEQEKTIISLEDLLAKEYEIISSDDALTDVIPPKWDKGVFDGSKRIKIGLK